MKSRLCRQIIYQQSPPRLTPARYMYRPECWTFQGHVWACQLKWGIVSRLRSIESQVQVSLSPHCRLLVNCHCRTTERKGLIMKYYQFVDLKVWVQSCRLESCLKQSSWRTRLPHRWDAAFCRICSLLPKVGQYPVGFQSVHWSAFLLVRDLELPDCFRTFPTLSSLSASCAMFTDCTLTHSNYTHSSARISVNHVMVMISKLDAGSLPIIDRSNRQVIKNFAGGHSF